MWVSSIRALRGVTLVRGSLAVAGLGVALVSCGTADTGTNTSALTTPSSSTTEHGNAGCPSGPGYESPEGTHLFGVVAFGLSASQRQGDRLQEGTSSDGRRFSKIPVFIKGPQTVIIDIPAVPNASRVDIEGWRERATARIAPRIVLRQRAPGRCSAWVAHPGGLVFSQAHCARVRIRVGTRTAFVPFGLGTDCTREERGQSSVRG